MRLSKQELKYIKQYKEKMAPSDIANKLNRNIETIKRHIKRMREEEQKKLAEEVFTEETETKKNSYALNLMGRRSGAVTMTEAASMYADEALRKNKNMPTSRYKSCIKIFRKDDPIR